MSIILLLLSLILAQGKGFVVTPHDIFPYWQAYSKTHGEPHEVNQKKEILINYLGDFLMVKRAKELGLDKTSQFKRIWKEAQEELKTRCTKEKVSTDKCERMGKAIKKVILIQMVIQREVLPRIKISEEEIQTLVISHKGNNSRKKLDRTGAIMFLQQKKRAEVLNSYILELMKRYKVKINIKALKKLNNKIFSLQHTSLKFH